MVNKRLYCVKMPCATDKTRVFYGGPFYFYDDAVKFVRTEIMKEDLPLCSIHKRKELPLPYVFVYGLVEDIRDQLNSDVSDYAVKEEHFGRWDDPMAQLRPGHTEAKARDDLFALINKWTEKHFIAQGGIVGEKIADYQDLESDKNEKAD